MTSNPEARARRIAALAMAATVVGFVAATPIHAARYHSSLERAERLPTLRIRHLPSAHEPVRVTAAVVSEHDLTSVREVVVSAPKKHRGDSAPAAIATAEFEETRLDRALAHRRAPRPAALELALEIAQEREDASMRRVIANRLSALRDCYQRELLHHPHLAGKLVFAIQVSPDGRVKSARTRSNSLRSKPVEQCALERIANWRFPRPPNSETLALTVPVVFAE